MTDHNDEFFHAISSGLPKRIAQACAHVDNEKILGALRFAVFKHRDIKVVQELVKHAQPHGLVSVLQVAVHRNNMPAFDLVWEHVAPNENKQSLLREAVLRGNLHCVKKICREQQVQFGHELLAQACRSQDAEMVDFLYDICDPKSALEYLSQEQTPRKNKRLLIERIEQEQLRQRLLENVETTTTTKLRKI